LENKYDDDDNPCLPDPVLNPNATEATVGHLLRTISFAR